MVGIPMGWIFHLVKNYGVFVGVLFHRLESDHLRSIHFQPTGRAVQPPMFFFFFDSMSVTRNQRLEENRDVQLNQGISTLLGTNMAPKNNGFQ